MKKFARIVAGISTLSLLATVVGCGAGDKKAHSDVTTVEIWTGDTASKAVYTKIIDNYNNTTGKEKGIYINYVVKDSGSYGQALDLAFKTDAAPDMYSCPNVSEYAEKDRMMALEDLEGLEELLETRKPWTRDFYNAYNGKTYNVPTSGGTQGLVYNKEMFKAAGLVDDKGEPTPPKTWDEFREYAKKLTNESKREYGVILPMKWAGWYDSDIGAAAFPSLGIRNGYVPNTGKFDFSGYKPILETFLGIRDDKSYMPGAETIDNDVARARFAEGGIGMKIAFSFDVGVYNDQFPAKIDWGVAPLPVIDINDHYCGTNDPGSSIVINKNSKIDPKILAEVFNFMVGDDMLVELYKNCVSMPYNPEIVEGIEIKTPKKGWNEFCELLKDTKTTAVNVKNDVSDQITIQQNFINKVWVDEMTVDEALAQETKIRNEGIEKYKAMHPEYDGSKYIIPDYDARIPD